MVTADDPATHPKPLMAGKDTDDEVRRPQDEVQRHDDPGRDSRDDARVCGEVYRREEDEGTEYNECPPLGPSGDVSPSPGP